MSNFARSEMGDYYFSATPLHRYDAGGGPSEVLGRAGALASYTENGEYRFDIDLAEGFEMFSAGDVAVIGSVVALAAARSYEAEGILLLRD